MSFNKVQLVGNLGADAQVASVGDKFVINFSVATTEKSKDQEFTTWFKVAYFVTKDTLAQYLVKGTQVFVDGRLRLEEYKDKDGNARTSLKIMANDVQLIGGKASAESEAPKKAKKAAAGSDEDIPF